MSSATINKVSIRDVKAYLESNLNDNVSSLGLMDIVVNFAQVNSLTFEASRNLVFETMDAQMIKMDGAYQVSLVK